ncbi:hypothetical protein [Butyricicoccus porcorum]|uniref:Uncharacterized protein n=1 Tax=Butyricicoccus porcorum TaxID=1945634 RepID=A0A252F1C4_9FIRM|nr:hypothetical protein [Butyricicoccus porcorum]MCI6925613.1 hypothetical protein [Butyricicoccus porcorum]MDD6986590.1 hypothetical protein [Butyricicoccus porcorum]MDY4482414.1 hypothetical protein [Butyricicoccus porcorum]OUM19471.1 hypothetical protein CBW42_12995 [Butyricicoccus porcorum]
MESLDIEELYRAAERSRLNAFESARQDSLKRLQNSLDEIGTSYRGSVTQAQTAARISALGQEEKLAASGLSSGGSYTAPTSGYTETARVASDNNLRSNLNTLSAARLQQEQEARNASNTEIAQARQSYENSAAEIRMQQAQAQINQYNTDREYNYNVRVTAYQQAMQRWQTYGIVLPADASILGVPAGTRTASSAYDNAKLALERWKALL